MDIAIICKYPDISIVYITVSRYMYRQSLRS